MSTSEARVNSRPDSVVKRWLPMAVSVALAGVLLYLSMRGIDWSQVRRLVSGATSYGVGLMIALNMAALVLRAIRWRVLLSAEAPVDFRIAFFATSAGYLANNVLPARAGEVLRTLMISRRTGIGRTFTLTTAFLERVADAIALVTISGLVLAFWATGPEWLSRAAVPVAVAGLCGLAAMVFLPRMKSWLTRVLSSLPLRGRVADRSEYMLHQVLHGIGSFHDAGRVTRFVALTIVIWCIDAVLIRVGAQAIRLEIALPLAFLLVAGLGLASALPSTPGYVGIFQFVAVGVLTPSGLTRSEAIAFILFWQAINYLVVSFWGAIALLAEKRENPMRAADAAGRSV
ncbi:MAG TPA: lysylphosphatidylglycerol synthase transmembrane domain-containing protein [Bryobacteraceae bacterium]|nr:lysylphosphatidylglycerol synthase transmembrane domain-containing protein [Bryobacteraceae bacterium]